MAEIPIERKPRRSVSPLLLVLLLIALAAAGWYLWTTYGETGQTGTTTSSATPLIQTASISVPAVQLSSFRRA